MQILHIGLHLIRQHAGKQHTAGATALTAASYQYVIYNVSYIHRKAPFKKYTHDHP